MIEAEQAVLSAMMFNPKCIDDVIEVIGYQHFENVRHAAIFDTIVKLASEGQEVDQLSVAEKLPHEFEYITDLSINSVTKNPVSYANIIERESFRRNALAKLSNAIEILANTRNIDDDLNQVQSILGGIERNDHKELISFDQIMKDGLNRLDFRLKNKGQIFGAKTGFSDLDDQLCGISSTDLVILAARPSMGKTALMLNMAYNMSEEGEVLIFSMEMSKEQLFDRLACAVGGIDAKRFKTGSLNDDEWPLLESAIYRMKQRKITIIDRAAMHINEIRAICRKFNRKNKLAGIFVDYLQLARGAKGSGNRAEEISDISRQLKSIAKDTETPVVALSQLNRGVETRPNKRPVTSDLRESGQIEQDADIIMFMYRDEYYNEDSPEKGICEVITSKARNGETGTTRLRSQLNFCRFQTLAADYRPPEPQNTYKDYAGGYRYDS